MKPLIIITGPQAVGKMSVGMALRDKYNYRLFHNHMTIEMIVDLYGELSKETKPLVNQIRELIFDNVVTQQIDGFIFTFLWGFNLENDHIYIDKLIKKFETHDWDVTIVELEADVDVRLERNRTELRLVHKATKRNVEWSDKQLKNSMEKYRLNSYDGEITHPSYIRINNMDLEPDEVAERIYRYLQESQND